MAEPIKAFTNRRSMPDLSSIDEPITMAPRVSFCSSNTTLPCSRTMFSSLSENNSNLVSSSPSKLPTGNIFATRRETSVPDFKIISISEETIRKALNPPINLASLDTRPQNWINSLNLGELPYITTISNHMDLIYKKKFDWMSQYTYLKKLLDHPDSRVDNSLLKFLPFYDKNLSIFDIKDRALAKYKKEHQRSASPYEIENVVRSYAMQMANGDFISQSLQEIHNDVRFMNTIAQSELPLSSSLRLGKHAGGLTARQKCHKLLEHTISPHKFVEEIFNSVWKFGRSTKDNVTDCVHLCEALFPPYHNSPSELCMRVLSGLIRPSRVLKYILDDGEKLNNPNSWKFRDIGNVSVGRNRTSVLSASNSMIQSIISNNHSSWEHAFTNWINPQRQYSDQGKISWWNKCDNFSKANQEAKMGRAYLLHEVISPSGINYVVDIEAALENYNNNIENILFSDSAITDRYSPEDLQDAKVYITSNFHIPISHEKAQNLAANIIKKRSQISSVGTTSDSTIGYEEKKKIPTTYLSARDLEKRKSDLVVADFDAFTPKRFAASSTTPLARIAHTTGISSTSALNDFFNDTDYREKIKTVIRNGYITQYSRTPNEEIVERKTQNVMDHTDPAYILYILETDVPSQKYLSRRNQNIPIYKKPDRFHRYMDNLADWDEYEKIDLNETNENTKRANIELLNKVRNFATTHKAINDIPWYIQFDVDLPEDIRVNEKAISIEGYLKVGDLKVIAANMGAYTLTDIALNISKFLRERYVHNFTKYTKANVMDMARIGRNVNDEVVVSEMPNNPAGKGKVVDKYTRQILYYKDIFQKCLNDNFKAANEFKEFHANILSGLEHGKFKKRYEMYLTLGKAQLNLDIASKKFDAYKRLNRNWIATNEGRKLKADKDEAEQELSLLDTTYKNLSTSETKFNDLLLIVSKEDETSESYKNAKNVLESDTFKKQYEAYLAQQRAIGNASLAEEQFERFKKITPNWESTPDGLTLQANYTTLQSASKQAMLDYALIRNENDRLDQEYHRTLSNVNKKVYLKKSEEKYNLGLQEFIKKLFIMARAIGNSTYKQAIVFPYENDRLSVDPQIPSFSSVIQHMNTQQRSSIELYPSYLLHNAKEIKQPTKEDIVKSGEMVISVTSIRRSNFGGIDPDLILFARNVQVLDDRLLTVDESIERQRQANSTKRKRRSKQ